ncbi:MAG: subtype A tannase [Propionicimonas sp.]
MEASRRSVLGGTAAAAFLAPLGLAGCTTSSGASSSGASSSVASSATGSLSFDGTAWNYDETNDVYWQIGRTYVSNPGATDYETLGVFVPGTYLTATKNSDGATYTATVNTSGKVGSYTSKTAPIVFPVNTPGYSAQKPPSAYSYDEVSAYLKAGFVYVAAGLRGKDSNTSSYSGNAPWGVTDLKAAVRYVRYNAELIPGDKDSMFVFGHSGGGAQSSVMGASGDADLYTPYLQSLGAAMTDANGKAISDAIAGVMAWCPITSLDYANAAYEWNMGQFASTGTRAAGTWTQAYSADLASAFADHINKLGLKGGSTQALSLAPSATGTYLSGSYYDQLISVITTSLNNFLADTTFPYTPSTTTMAGMGGGPPPGGGTPPSGAMPPGGGTPPGGAAPAGGGTQSAAASTTYQTVEDYIASLNTDTTWVTYDAASNTASVANLEGFVKSQKNASKDVGAFDGVDRGQTENVVFGLGTSGLHFAPVSKDTIAANGTKYASLTGWSDSYAASEYEADFAKTDNVGKDVAYRTNLYNPMYFLSSYYDGHKTSTVAPHWRIRTGIMQGDTANTVEVNLALALQDLGVNDVDFATVWGQGHTMAERTGDATTNFIDWVNQTLA